MLEVFIHKDQLIFIDVDMSPKLASVQKLTFEGYGVFEY